MPNGLSVLSQEDFSAGAFPGYSRDSIPNNGVEDAVNCLITDDGQLTRRGGSILKSAGTATDATFLWDGYLTPGLRTMFGSTADWWTLQSDDVTPQNLGGAGTSTLAKGAAVGGMLFLPGGAIWGGSRLTTTLSVTGEIITASNGSATITTANPPTTAWTSTYIQPGTLFRVVSGPTFTDHSYYVVKSLDSNHQITLTTPWRGQSGLDFVNFEFVQFGVAPQTGLYFAAANKLLTIVGDKVYESPINDPSGLDSTNYHQLPAGATGLGGEALRDTAVVFSTEGVYAINNIAYDLTDDAGNPQQSLQNLNGDLILWSWPGIAHWGNSLVVPAVDGVWLLDTVSQPHLITGGMQALYRSYVEAGYQTGYGTVFKNHYLLPILDGSRVPVDLLVCRLTPTRRGQAFGWSRFANGGGNVVGFTNRTPTASSRQTKLFGASGTGGSLNELKYWDPATTTDTGAASYDATVVSRELTGDVSTKVTKLRIRYELTDPSTVNPTLSAEWAHAGGSYTTLLPSATETTEPTVNHWLVNKRNPHFRLKTSGATSNFTLHSLSLLIRPSGRQ